MISVLIDSHTPDMPPDSGMAFVVVQHLSPDYKSLMVELLSKRNLLIYLQPVLHVETRR